MREIHVDSITEQIKQLCINATHKLPEDVRAGLRKAESTEKNPLAQKILADLIQNFTRAEDQMVPLCQDTGTAVVFVELGQDVHIVGGLLQDAINHGVARGYQEGFLRASIVEHPFSSRNNTQNNTPALIHYEIVAGDRLHLKFLPKGAGCENMSRFANFLPRAGKNAVIEFLLRTIDESAGNPCPPLVIGVGIGGTAEYALTLAKKAIARGVGTSNPDPEVAALEQEMLTKVNALGIGPQAVGGINTALTVNVLTHPTHIASLPVGINIQCHSARSWEAYL